MNVPVWEKTWFILTSLALIFITTAAGAQERDTGISSGHGAAGAPVQAVADSISGMLHKDAPDTLIRQLDKVFEGRWQFKIIEQRFYEDLVIVLGELSGGGGTRQQYGTAVLKPADAIGEALKAAALDAFIQAAKLFDLRSDTTAAVSPGSRTDSVRPATNHTSLVNPAKIAVPTIAAVSSPNSSVPETWFDPATTRYVGTPMEPEVIDTRNIDFNRYMLEPFRINAPPKLDGFLDDPIWRESPVAGGFRQRNPSEGYLDTENTEVRVLYDEENLYFGFMCYDRSPGKVVATEMRRDEVSDMNDDDVIEIYIAPLGETGDTYFFTTNPLGARGDILMGSSGNSYNTDWDATWQCYTKRHSMGWSVEFVIPFKAFRFDPEAKQGWAINFGRFVQRTRAGAFWVPVSRTDAVATRAYDKGGRLVGLDGIKPGRALEVLPYSVMGSIGDRNALPTGEKMNFGMRRNAGLDLKWGMTPNITADITANPDFAQIEADREVVNLSRFEFRFDERRPFFLEGVTIFEFGDSFFSPLPIFFSRRIGTQLFDGSTVQILHGEKISGKTGGTSFGMLNVHTRETPWVLTESSMTTVSDTTETGGGVQVSQRDTLSVSRFPFTEPETNWNVFRLRQNLFSRSTLGVIGLMKEPEDTPDGKTDLPGLQLSDTQYNRVVGGDLRLQFNSTEHLFNVLVARSWLHEAELRRRVLADNDSTLLDQNALAWAGAITHSWRTSWINTTSSYTDIRGGFFSDMGFIPRRDIRQGQSALGMNLLVRKWGIRSIGSSARGRGSLISGRWITNHRGGFFDRGQVESWIIAAKPGIEFENGMNLRFGWERNFDRISQLTTIAGVDFPSGGYTFDSYTAEISTDKGKPISIEGAYTQGEFYDGARRTIEAETTWKPASRVRIGVDLTYNRLERPQTEEQSWFDERWIPRFRFNFSFSPDMFISLFAQMNTRRTAPGDELNINALVSNFLFAYTMPQGHTFFLAYNQLTDDAFNLRGQRALRPASQAVVAKFSYLLNL